MLYAFVRRGTIEHVLDDADADPGRVAQAERARAETDRWLAANDLEDALTETEARLLGAESGLWPPEAIVDAVWQPRGPRRPAVGARAPRGGSRPTTPSSTSRRWTRPSWTPARCERFRAVSRLRDDDELLRALGEADTWHGAPGGRRGRCEGRMASAVRGAPVGAQLAARRRMTARRDQQRRRRPAPAAGSGSPARRPPRRSRRRNPRPRGPTPNPGSACSTLVRVRAASGPVRPPRGGSPSASRGPPCRSAR